MRLVEIYRGANYVDAQLVKGLLQANGIDVHLLGEWLQGGVGELAPHDLFRIRVPENQVAVARSVLDDYEKAELPDDWEDQAEGKFSA